MYEPLASREQRFARVEITSSPLRLALKSPETRSRLASYSSFEVHRTAHEVRGNERSTAVIRREAVRLRS